HGRRARHRRRRRRPRPRRPRPGRVRPVGGTGVPGEPARRPERRRGDAGRVPRRSRPAGPGPRRHRGRRVRRHRRRPDRAAGRLVRSRSRRRPRAARLTGMDGWAVVGGRLATRPVDVTADPAALDGEGFWVVVMTFEGELTCVRMDEVRPVGDWYAAAPPWSMPPPSAWTSSLDRTAYVDGVGTIRDRIARGDVYQVNLCRLL